MYGVVGALARRAGSSTRRAPRDPGADLTAAASGSSSSAAGRSYRALFGWLSPWILIPTFIVEPVFQVLFFAFVGRDAGVGEDTFFLIGNAMQFASIPCLFAMGNTIGGER